MDLIYNITGLRSPISKIRIKKFVSNTEFTSSKIVNDFVPPYTLTEGLKRTLNHEFILQKKRGSIFFPNELYAPITKLLRKIFEDKRLKIIFFYPIEKISPKMKDC